MGDCATVFLAGNLGQDVEIVQVAGQSVAQAPLAIGQMQLVQGQVEYKTLWIMIEVRGSAAAYAFAVANGQGSRIVCQGHLVPTKGGHIRVVVDSLLGEGEASCIQH